MIYSIDRVALILILLLPLVLFFAWRKDTVAYRREKRYLECLLVGVIVAFAVQTHDVYTSFMVNGRFGAYASRYYLCAIGVLALAVMWIVCKLVRIRHSDNSLDSMAGPFSAHLATPALTAIGAFAVSCFILLLVFDGYIYSVLYYYSG